MNHSLYIQGAGLFSKPKPKPAVLRPPNTGLFPNISSYSVSEVVDLISDGPIYGLVNKSGQKDTIFQGIYLNNTPIESYVKNDDDLILAPSGTGDNPYDTWFSEAQEFFDQFFSNNQTVVGYSYAGNAKNLFAVLSMEGKGKENDMDDKGRALLQFPFITQDHTAISAIKRSMPFKDNIGGTNFSVISSGTYSGDTIDTDFLINSSNNNDLKEAIQESFYFKHSNENFEIHYYNNEDEPELGIARSGTILYEFKNLLEDMLDITGTNLQKVRYAFADKALKRLDKITTREFGIKKHIRFGNDKSGGFDAWGSSVEAIYPQEEIALVFKLGASGSNIDLGFNSGLYNDVDDTSYVVIETETDDNLNKLAQEYVEDGDEAVKEFQFQLQKEFGINEKDYNVLFIPERDNLNSGDYKSIRLTGQGYGVLVVFVKIRERKLASRKFPNDIYRFARSWHLLGLPNWTGGNKHNIQIVKTQSSASRKFNFASVTCEFRRGGELQSPLKHFHYSNVDYEYNAPLYGPFRTKVENGSGVFRIKEDIKIWEDDGGDPRWSVTGWTAFGSGGNPFLNGPTTGGQRKRAESSEDIRTTDSITSFSNWNDTNEWNEESSPVTHYIENPEITHVGFALIIQELKDTLSQDLAGSSYKAGDPYPTVLHMHAQWGKIGPNGETNVSSQRFKIVGLVQSPTVIDFGAVSKDNSDANNESFYNEMYESYGDPFVQESNDWDRNGEDWRDAPVALFNPISLPTLSSAERFKGIRRFLRIFKVSAETNSVLLSKEVSLLKVTEFIKNKFRYPYCAIVGSKFDSRYFSSIPNRSFDCRLKLIRIPSNYEPLNEFGIDKRYLENSSDPKEQIYVGDWDGTFKLGWTDNPAWILYDLLTSERYGLGNYIDRNQINIWELYKIGRFCDAVDDLGYFVGVSDLNGGLEPRYSCNIIFNENTRVFDAINVVANLFRGSVFFNNSEITFADDRPKTPIALFNNANVEDGLFNYTNYRRDQQFNTVEVAYLDRLDDYKTKIEYVEDIEDVRNRGIIKTTINTLGVTSKSMARRIGKHLIHQTLYENQGIEFAAGLESLLCKPGDLITVDDEMRSRSRSFGRILSITPLAASGSYKTGLLTLDEPYDSTNYSDYINVYTPTGNYDYNDMKDLSKSNRMRVDSFQLDVASSSVSGEYKFSGYALGYANPNYLQSEYFAFYTGANQKTAYFSTGSGFWIFTQSGSNIARSIDNLYDITEIQGGSGSLLLTDGVTPINISSFSFEGYTDGITDDEISLNSNVQTSRFYLNSKTNLDYGCEVRVRIPEDDSKLIDSYSSIELGSVYRFENDSIKAQTYKIVSIRENNANSYSIVATKYDTGKYELIDNLTRAQIKEETSFNGIPSLEDEPENQLDVPATFSGSKSSGTISLSWSSVSNADAYFVEVYNKENDIRKSKRVTGTSTSFNYDSNITSYWMAKIIALGDDVNYTNSETKRLRL